MTVVKTRQANSIRIASPTQPKTRRCGCALRGSTGRGAHVGQRGAKVHCAPIDPDCSQPEQPLPWGLALPARPASAVSHRVALVRDRLPWTGAGGGGGGYQAPTKYKFKRRAVAEMSQCSGVCSPNPPPLVPPPPFVPGPTAPAAPAPPPAPPGLPPGSFPDIPSARWCSKLHVHGQVSRSRLLRSSRANGSGCYELAGRTCGPTPRPAALKRCTAWGCGSRCNRRTPCGAFAATRQFTAHSTGTVHNTDQSIPSCLICPRSPVNTMLLQHCGQRLQGCVGQSAIAECAVCYSLVEVAKGGGSGRGTERTTM
jgi:hypothetical protein